MTETQTVDLAAWLTRIWDEEERLARRVADRYLSTQDGEPYWPVPSVAARLNQFDDPDIRAGLDLIKMHNPQAVLARIAADRKILELHRGPHDCRVFKTGTYPQGWTGEGSPGGQWTYVSTERFADQPCPTKLLLASPYKGREGWQESWE